MKRHLKITVKGKVQNVAFRAYTHMKAKELGINGFVKNQDDGSVYIELEAEKSLLEKMLLWFRKGSPNSKVKCIEIQETTLSGFEQFKIMV